MKGEIEMYKGYQYGWEIEDGFLVLTSDHLTSEEIDKRWYVHQFLDPSVREARCGWYGIVYCVGDVNGENRREYVLMFADSKDTPRMARWINVTGNSKGAIAEAVWNLVFA